MPIREQRQALLVGSVGLEDKHVVQQRVVLWQPLAELCGKAGVSFATSRKGASTER